MLKDVSKKWMGLVGGYAGPSKTNIKNIRKGKKGGMNEWAQCFETGNAQQAWQTF